MKFKIKYLTFIILLSFTITCLSAPKKTKYDNYIANSYYYVKSLVFSKDMITKEKFLISLLESIEKEMLKRRSDNKKVKFPSNEDIKKISKDLNLINFKIDDKKLGEMVTGFKQKTLEEYNLELLKARMYKTSLVETATPKEKQEMFNKDFKLALKKVALSEYNFAYFILNEILSSYNYKDIDDVLFFKAECLLNTNNLTEALKIYIRIVDEFKKSNYKLRAYDRIIVLQYLKTHYDKVLKFYNSADKDFAGSNSIDDKMLYISGLSAYKLLKYAKANEIFSKIKKDSYFYNQSVYLKANSLTMLKKYSEAEKCYTQVRSGGFFSSNSAKNMVFEGSLLKLGYLNFNKIEENSKLNEYSKKRLSQPRLDSLTTLAYNYFDKVPSNSQYFEDAIIGKAWVEHNLGNYKKSNKYISELLENNPNSEFLYEARTLRGYNNTLLKIAGKINKDYEYVLDAQIKFDKNIDYNSEKFGVLKDVKELVQIKKQLLEEYKPIRLFKKYYSLKSKLMILLKSSSSYLVNLKKTHPNIAKIAKSDYEDKVLGKILNGSRRELDKLNNMYNEISRLQQITVNKSNYNELAKLTIEKDRLLIQMKQADIIGIYSNNRLGQTERKNINLQKWSDLSFIKYILSNIGIEKLDEIENKIESIQQKIDSIDDELEASE